MADSFAGFELRHVHGVPVLWARDERFKTLRVIVQARRPLDERAAARAVLPGLLLHGTLRDRNRPAIAQRMERLYGGTVVPATHKHGEIHALRLVLDCVSGRFLPDRPDQLGEGFAFLADLAARPRLDGGGFPSAVFERERRNAVDAVRAMIDDRGSYAFQRAIQIACEGEPMAIPEHGGIDALQGLTRDEPEAARRDFLAHGEAFVVACGAFGAAELERAVETFVAALPPRDPEPLGPAVVVERRDPRHHVDRVELQQSKLVMVLRFPFSMDPDVWVGRRLLIGMLGGGPHSRLFREVREKRSLAYYASASADRYKGLLTVQVGLDESAAASAEAEVLRQLELLTSGGFEDDELETARAQLVNAVQGVDDSVAGRCQFVSEQWALGIDRDAAQLLECFRAADRDQVIGASQGIWPDLVYLLAPRGAGAV